MKSRDAAVVFAVVIAVGLLWLGAQFYLFGPDDRVLSLLTTHFSLSADLLTTVCMTFYCVLLALALVAGRHFLHRFLIQPRILIV
ncbi:MAG: hypothetical protein ACRYFS_02415 [Janthinobacterium lividum]